MFTVADTPVKFVGLLVLFVFTTAWSAYELARPQTWRQRVSNVLHLVMSLVMLAMVSEVTWRPLAAAVGMPVLLGFFVVGVLWFCYLAVHPGGRRAVAHFVGHAAMFGAMAWHLAGMTVMGTHMSSGMGEGMGRASGVGGPLWGVAVAGLPFMAYLLISSVLDLVAALRTPAVAPHGRRTTPGTPSDAPRPAGKAGVLLDERIATSVTADHVGERPEGLLNEHVAGEEASCGPGPTGTATVRLARLAGFAMNFGMFWMSTGLLIPVLPFMRYFGF